MNTKTITLKTLLTSKLLRYHLRRYFAQYFQSDYIAVQTKFVLGDNENPTQSLGNKFILNVRNRAEVDTYINMVMDAYNTKYLNKYTPDKISQIKFIHIFVDKNDYVNFLSKLSQEKSFNEDIGLGILPDFNIPFNVNYKSWGNISLISKDKFEVRNCIFNKDIIYLSVFIEDGNLSHVNIIFNDINKSSESFSDRTWGVF